MTVVFGTLIWLTAPRLQAQEPWVTLPTRAEVKFNAVASDGAHLYAACGDYGVVACSTNGADWIVGHSGTSDDLKAIVWWGGEFVATGINGTGVATRDGVSWLDCTPGTDAELWTVLAAQINEPPKVAEGLDGRVTIGARGALEFAPRVHEASMISIGIGWGGTSETISIRRQPADQTVVAGRRATFICRVTSSSPPTFQWYHNGQQLTNIPGKISGAQTATLTLNNVQASQAGEYYLVAENVHAITSEVAALNVLIPPAITAQPVGATNLCGTSVLFSAEASGTAPFRYQWYRNRVAVRGATNSTLTLTNLQPTHAGSYNVLAVNKAGSAVSLPATLKVLVPPRIVVQPKNRSVLTGKRTILSATVSGTSVLHYQWYRDNQALTNSPGSISGANTSSLVLSGLQPERSGNYWFVVQNQAGTATSQVAQVTVTTPVRIVHQPSNLAVFFGDSTHFEVVVEGTNPQFQWYFNDTPLQGETNPTLDTATIEGRYKVVVSNAVGKITSRTVKLQFMDRPSGVIIVGGV